MKSRLFASGVCASALALAGCASTTMADDDMETASASTATTASASAPNLAPTATVGGATLSASRTLADNAMLAPNLSQVVALIQRANLADTLRGAGPYTLLAPNNDAFTRVPAETMARVNADPDLLRRALTYHVLPGRFTFDQIKERISAGGGTATFETVNGNPMRARMQGDLVVLEGENSSIAYLARADVPSSNGLLHVINGVLIPPALG